MRTARFTRSLISHQASQGGSSLVATAFAAHRLLPSHSPTTPTTIITTKRHFASDRFSDYDMSYGSKRERDAKSNTALPNEKDGSKDAGEAEWRKQLGEQQYRVLRQKGTDRPGTGEYDKFYEDGTYVCSGCGTPLYTSKMKFNTGCGWPGFWDCLPKAVREEADADGSRVEILCNACNGHLGHVFRGEGFDNPLNERHCVNSTSIKHVPK